MGKFSPRKSSEEMTVLGDVFAYRVNDLDQLELYRIMGSGECRYIMKFNKEAVQDLIDVSVEVADHV